MQALNQKETEKIKKLINEILQILANYEKHINKKMEDVRTSLFEIDQLIHKNDFCAEDFRNLVDQ